MPFLAGGNLVDASGNALVDASSAYLGEAGIQVIVRGGILMASQSPIEDAWKWVRDNLIGDVTFIDWITELMRNLTEWNVLNAIAGNLEKFLYIGSASQETMQGSDHTYTGTTLAGILEAIAAIETSGGLTQQEHDQLMGLEDLDYDQIASAVWGYTLAMDDNLGAYWGPMAQTVLTSLGSLAQKQAGLVGWPVAGNPYFTFCPVQLEQGVGWLGDWSAQALGAGMPLLDLSLVQEGDTVLSFLQREYPTFDWTLNGPVTLGTTGVVWVEGSENQYYWRCNLRDADLAVAHVPDQISELVVDVNVVAAPVWPGLAGVTLGSAISLGNSGTITETMDGVLVEISDADQDHRYAYSYDGQRAWRNIGALAFVDDQGHLEMWQPLGFESALYTPKSMAHAAAVKWFTSHGPQGTIQPWVVTS